MPTTRQKRKSTEAENAIPAENITLPAKLKRNDEKPLKNSRKNGPTGGVESANLRTRSKKQDSKKFVDSSSSSQRKRKKQGETTDASLKEDMSKNSENCTKRSVTTKERTCALKNINKIKTEKNSTEKKIIKRKTCQPKSAESASHDKEESKKVKMLSEGSLTDKGDQQDEKSGASESDDDFDVISSCENVSKVMLKNSKVKSGKQIGAKKIRKTSVSGEVVTRKGKKSQTKKIETKSNSAGKSHIPKIERILTKIVKPKNDLGKSKDSMTNIKLMKEEDVTTVLMQMEGKVDETDGPLTMDVSTSSKEEMDSSAESDWEEVADHPFGSPNKSQIPSGPVQVRLEVPDIMKKKRKKKTFDAAAYCRRLINRFEKNCLIQLHKVHMMCLLSHGLHCARLGQRSILKAQALSLVPTEFLKKRPKSYDSQSINSLTMWFSGLLVRDPDLEATSINQGVLVNRFSNQKVSTGKELVLMLFSLLTVLGLDVRIIFSMQPMPWKTTLKDSGKTADRKSRTTKNSSQKSHGGKDVSHKQDQPSSSKKQEGKTAHNCKKSENQTSKYFKESQNRKLKGNLKNSHLQETEKTSKHDSIDRRDHSSKKKSCTGEEKQKSTSNSNKRKSRVKNSLRRSCASKLSKSQNEQTLSEESANEFEEESGDSDYSNYSDEEQGKKVQRKPRVQKTAKKTKSTSEDLISSSDFTRDSPDEFEEETVTFRKSPAYNMNRKYKEKTVSRKVVSSDTDDSRTPPKTTNKKGNDWWLEVFSEKDEKWICVDVVHNVVNKPEGMEKSATQPITYVIAFDNHGCVKDVTSRYASQWMSHTRKLRVDVDWWEETIEPYRTLNTQQDRLEDLVLKAEQIKKPLPQVVGEYKNHPLYALRRHLLKFEAIYPDTAVPLGYVRNEPVYARECVHTLHSRDNWLKEGRIVKLGMTPYKMVKSRPKWNKPKENPDELDLEVFGVWQTDIYVPPPAENGKIYKNEYGNIELFKPSMLPAGTVHIRIEGLKRVAKKLDIDCVPAMVGWDHHSGCAHPVLDGFVVCKEHEDILLSAWEEDQEQQRQREILKKQKRVYGNWKLFVRGLLIKERLKKRFDLETASDPDKAKLKTGSGEKATDTECSWPRNRQNKTKSKKQSKQDCLVEVEQL